jgi:DNA-binding response OmpR family regulator
MTIFLKNEGYEVESTLNGDEVLIKTKTFKPDLIIMDIFLSGTNGKDICRNLKNENKTKSIPIILISAHSQIKKIVKDCGANGFINKPFEAEDLLYGVSNFLPPNN